MRQRSLVSVAEKRSLTNAGPLTQKNGGLCSGCPVLLQGEAVILALLQKVVDGGCRGMPLSAVGQPDSMTVYYIHVAYMPPAPTSRVTLTFQSNKRKEESFLSPHVTPTTAYRINSARISTHQAQTKAFCPRVRRPAEPLPGDQQCTVKARPPREDID
ncbi:hypothetical protein BaRGS_00015737 [Batillaria attramentaria]|uniref:Uncharacterized protein n=1 Tax=Batillaria attramentaria TaxID=370345 RepID=A0ABD0L0T4_9CAEN